MNAKYCNRGLRILISFSFLFLPACVPVAPCKISSFKVSPKLGLAAGQITEVGGSYEVSLAGSGCSTTGADACVLEKLQNGLLRDLNDAKKGKIAWSDYNVSRKETLNLIEGLQVACGRESGTKPAGGPGGKPVKAWIADAESLNARKGY